LPVNSLTNSSFLNQYADSVSTMLYPLTLLNPIYSLDVMRRWLGVPASADNAFQGM
jgi:hypothetical protein